MFALGYACSGHGINMQRPTFSDMLSRASWYTTYPKLSIDPLSGGPFAYQRTPDGYTLGTTNVERPILHLKSFPLFQNYSSFCPF